VNTEQAVIQVYISLVREHRCSADTILESPELREQYLLRTRQLLGHLPEQQLLHHLTKARKGGRLPRSRELPPFSCN
jgi:hypothetical protein